MMMTVNYSETQGGKVVKLHSAAIHIEHKATLTQQKMWLYLLYRAYHRLNERVVHEVDLPEIKRFLGTKHAGTTELKQALKALMGITLEWNIFGKDTEKWEAMPLISYCSIEKREGRNVIRYRFTEELCERLYDPDMYVKINLLMSQNFKGKHAFNLYLLALDYLRVKDNFGYKHVTIAEIRKYLGVQPDDYAAAYDFKRYVLRAAEKEINQKSDIELTITDIITGGKISGFRLEMRIKDEFLPVYQTPENVPALAAEPEPQVQQYPDAVTRFHEKHGVEVNAKPFREALKKAKAIVGNDLDAYLLYVVAKVAKKEKAPFINNVAGFYVSQFEDEGNILAFKRQQKEETEREAVAKVKVSEMMERELEKIYQTQDRKAFMAFISERLEDVEPQLAALLEEHGNAMIKQLLARNYGGSLTREAIASPAISPVLYKFAHTFGYLPLDYVSWRAAYIANPDHAASLESLRQATKLELSRV